MVRSFIDLYTLSELVYLQSMTKVESIIFNNKKRKKKMVVAKNINIVGLMLKFFEKREIVDIVRNYHLNKKTKRKHKNTMRYKRSTPKFCELVIIVMVFLSLCIFY